MTFLHKLSQRLARMKTALLIGIVTTIACEVPVADPWSSVSRLHLSPKTSTLGAGQTTQFTVVALTPTGDTANVGVRWAITGGSIVDTSTSGGKHYLQYRSPSEAGQYKVFTYSMVAGMSDSAVVTVSAVPVASLSVSPAAVSLTIAQAVQLTATPKDANGTLLPGRVVTWGSGNTGVATVSGSGLVTGAAAGATVITATSEGKSVTAAVTVTPTSVSVASVGVTPASANLSTGQTVQLTGTPLDASGTVLVGRVVTWSSGNVARATVSGNGFVTGVTAGVVTITATSEGIGGNASVTVTAPPPPTGGMWPNEPAGWSTVTDYGFDDVIPTGGDVAIGGGWRVVNGAGRITRSTDAIAPVSPSNVARIFYPQGFGAGSEPGTLYYSQGGTKDHYVGYEFKLSNPYSNHSVGTKQWYPYSATGNYFMLFGSDSKMWMTVQADGSHGGTYNLSGNVNNPTITLGAWHRIEVLQRYPTSSSSNDGILRWWIDGVLCGNYTNIGWNISSTYQELRFAPTWGGIGGSVAFDTDWQIDHVKISRP